MIAGHELGRNWINAKKYIYISKWKRKEYGTTPVAIKLLKQRLNDAQGNEDPRAEGEIKKKCSWNLKVYWIKKM
jgi:hypothetical protein